jgi:hypothetical protein
MIWPFPMSRKKLPEAVRKSELLQIRATPSEKAELLAAALQDGETFSEWALAILLKRARRPRKD